MKSSERAPPSSPSAAAAAAIVENRAFGARFTSAGEFEKGTLALEAAAEHGGLNQCLERRKRGGGGNGRPAVSELIFSFFSFLRAL